MKYESTMYYNEKPLKKPLMAGILRNLELVISRRYPQLLGTMDYPRIEIAGDDRLCWFADTLFLTSAARKLDLTKERFNIVHDRGLGTILVLENVSVDSSLRSEIAGLNADSIGRFEHLTLIDVEGRERRRLF